MKVRYAHGLRVVVLWSDTVWREHVFGAMDDTTITVGEDAGNRFVLPAPGVPERFEMFERTARGYKLRFSEALRGRVTLGSDAYALDELEALSLEHVDSSSGATVQIFEQELGEDDWGMVDFGAVRIHFQVLGALPVAPMRRLATGLSLALAGFIALSAVLHTGFLLTAFLSYSPEPEFAQWVPHHRTIDYIIPNIEEPGEEEEEDDAPEQEAAPGIDGEEGKLSKEDSEFEEVKLAEVDAEHIDKEVDVTNIGIHKALTSDLLGPGPLKEIFESSSDGFEAKLQVAMAGDFSDIQHARGRGGMGIRGAGRGGGGKGAYGTIGALADMTAAGRKRHGGATVARRQRRSPPPSKFTPGKPQIGDFCDKANIRRVVRAKTNAIKYCFERELQANPELSGKIVAQWNVMLDGSAKNQTIASSTMGNKAVESCIARVVGRLRFQKPKGGICVIQYPFVFSGLE
ncbi:MAG: AgmX/PglI C-terminal domain-containing protein [Myxococcota bacterium]